MRKVKFPSIAAVAAALRAENRSLAPYCTGHRDPDDDRSVDIRLQVYPNGSWAIRVGDASYDLDHHGYWGASSLDGRRFDSRSLAKDLLEQAKEQHACDDDAT
jgi:hypothetical protein